MPLQLHLASPGIESLEGREARTPALQAGLVKRGLTLKKIFETGIAFLASKNALFSLFDSAQAVSVAARRMPLAA